MRTLEDAEERHASALELLAWVGYTFYADRFDADDLIFRLGMLAAMLAITWLAIEIPRAFTARGGAAFAAPTWRYAPS